MSAWQRMKRIVRSWFGWGAELMEDPELILKQNLRDLEAEVPKLNQMLAEIAGQKNIAERELQKLKDQEKDTVSKMKASLTAGRRDIAANFAMEVEKLRPQIAEKERAVKAATDSLANAQERKKIFMAESEKKKAEAMRALSAKRQADWNEKVADTLANFKVGGVDQTHDEMIRRIEQRAATSEAKLQMALESKQANNFAIEEEARKIQAEETLRQLELEMGLGNAEALPKEAAADREKSIGPRERTGER